MLIPDILACGATTLDLLCSASGALLKSIETRSHSTSTTADTHLINVLDTLLAYANDHINAVNFQEVSRQWLRLYTDASLLRSAVDLLSPGPDAWREAVRRLDLTTIVAGSVGEGRSHWVQDLIREAQKNNARPATPLRPQKRVRHAHTQPEVHLSSWAAASIREMDAAPSFDRYVSQEYNRPFIVRGYASSWPALTRWKSAEYLLDTVGEGRVVPVETGLAYVDEDWGQTIMSFRTFLSRCGFDVEPEGRENRVLYLAQHTLFKQFPQLERDFVVPDYVWADLKSEEPNYEPVDADLVPLINVWIGHSDGHAISPAHTVCLWIDSFADLRILITIATFKFSEKKGSGWLRRMSRLI